MLHPTFSIHQSPGKWATEVGLLLAVVGMAYGVAVLLRRRSVADASSIWLGRFGVDGVLFPTIALLMAWGVQRAMPVVLGQAPGLLKLAMPILLSLLVIRLVARVLKAAWPEAAWVAAAERSVSWLAWGGMVLWITGLWPVAWAELESFTWKLGGTKVSLATILEAAFSVLLVMVGALWLSAAIEARLTRGVASDRLSGRKIAANLIKALLLFVGLMLALSSAGIDLTALGVLGGAFGVGLGLGLQKLASNYVSGFVILAEGSLRIGDVVMVDGFEGRITDIKTRYTVIRALNGRESIVPNELLITQRVENSSLADPKVAQTTDVSVGYATNLPDLIPVLRTAVQAVPRVLEDPAPGVQLTAFGADGLTLRIVYWMNDPENGLGNLRSDVNMAVLAALNVQGVDIPFPQRVVHHVGAVPSAH